MVGDKPHQDGTDTRPKHDRDQGLPSSKKNGVLEQIFGDLAFGRFFFFLAKPEKGVKKVGYKKGAFWHVFLVLAKTLF